MIKFRIAAALLVLSPMLMACSALRWQDPEMRSGPEVGSAVNYATALPTARLLPRALPVT